MSDLNLEPHEQLDEIDLRTNSDGSVQVKVIGWNKREQYDDVLVKYRTPTGDIETEQMPWPQSKNSDYKFIRLIEETPYTLRTANKINEDDDLWLDADPGSWDLRLPEPESLSERIPRSNSGIPMEIVKLTLFPLTLMSSLIMLLEVAENESVYGEQNRYHDTMIDDDVEWSRIYGAAKSGFQAVIWFGVLLLLL